MPTMRRSARGKSGAHEDESNAAVATPTRSSRRAAADAPAIAAAAEWSASPSPLSSISTPASSAVQARRMTRDRREPMAETNMDGSGGSGSDGNDSVDELLSKAAEVIRDKVCAEHSESEDEGEGEDEDEAREAKRQRSSSSPAKAGASRGGWWPGKRGRPPKSAAGLQRQHKQQIQNQMQNQRAEDEEDKDEDEEAKDADEDEAKDEDGDEGGGGDEDDDVDETDAAGEAKISRYGEMLGGREFICPVFRSPFRGGGRRLYVLSMDCCRFTGARDSYMLFKQHPRMRRVETTQQERDLLAERTMIPKVTRFRPIAMITARAAFREFGARLVKDGRYIVDDYWEAAKREEAKYPEGTPVANMSVYRSVMAAHAAGMAPGSTRVARRSTPLRSPIGGPSDQPLPSPSQQMPQSAAVSSWVQLEARQQQLRLNHQNQQPPPPRHAGRTMASALMLAPQLLGEADGGDALDDPHAPQASPSSSSAKPVFRRMRAAETAEAAFDSAASAHRAHFDDNGFVDGAPLAHSLAVSWTRAPSLANRLKQQQQQKRSTSDAEEDAFGPMAFASGRVAREFNASVRLWRDDNGCTWVDPHTGIRQ
ncbi:chromatin structure-remodeling complex subunit RSC7, partial [Coemansia sp. RSA 2681]